jgi:hypothetical protein
MKMNKKLYLRNLEEQKYLSTLKNDYMRFFYYALKEFAYMLKQQQNTLEKNKRLEIAAESEKRSFEAKKAKQQPESNGALSAKQKREAYQKKKLEETNAKKRIAIEENEHKQNT